jgi:alkylation response protein AidB-like acyl-CoA dehydrogenase
MSGILDAAPGGAAAWIAPLAAGLPELGDLDLRGLCCFDTALSDLLTEFRIDAGIEPALRSERLLHIRRELAASGHLAAAVATRDGGSGRPVVVQALMQFICGYHDIDLRDATGLGHGRLIARYANAPVRDRWLPRLLAGSLVGIAITEPHGGSQVQATTTSAMPRCDGTWAVSGVKTWISRLNEAAVFCVFFNDPAGRLTAAAVHARAAGLQRRPVLPAGLSGWTWGELHLDGVRIRQRDILGRPGDGMSLLRKHFANYRPLVAATALGAAAAACDTVTAHLNARQAAELITGPRDNALITIGRAYAQINAALLVALTAQRISEAGDDLAELWGCAAKAHGVDTAYAAARAPPRRWCGRPGNTRQRATDR